MLSNVFGMFLLCPVPVRVGWHLEGGPQSGTCIIRSNMICHSPAEFPCGPHECDIGGSGVDIPTQLAQRENIVSGRETDSVRVNSQEPPTKLEAPNLLNPLKSSCSLILVSILSDPPALISDQLLYQPRISLHSGVRNPRSVNDPPSSKSQAYS